MVTIVPKVTLGNDQANQYAVKEQGVERWHQLPFKVATVCNVSVVVALMALSVNQHGSDWINGWRALSLQGDSNGQFKMPSSSYVTLPGGYQVAPMIFSALTAVVTYSLAEIVRRV